MEKNIQHIAMGLLLQVMRGMSGRPDVSMKDAHS